MVVISVRVTVHHTEIQVVETIAEIAETQVVAILVVATVVILVVISVEIQHLVVNQLDVLTLHTAGNALLQ